MRGIWVLMGLGRLWIRPRMLMGRRSMGWLLLRGVWLRWVRLRWLVRVLLWLLVIDGS